MKKNVARLIAVIAMCVTLVGTLASCTAIKTFKLRHMDERERAFALFEIVDEKMDSLNSYTINGKYTMNLEIAGEKMEMEAKLVNKAINQNKKDYATYSETETTAKYPGMDDVTTVEFEGYYNGRLYLGNKQSDYEQRICSFTPLEKYKDYLEEKSEDFLTEESTTSATCTENEDGSWRIELIGDYDLAEMKESLDDMLASLSGGIELSHSKLVFDIGSDLYITSFSWEFVFISNEGDAKLPKFVCEFEVKDINKTKISSSTFEGYTEVDDVLALKKLEDAISDREGEKSGTFTRYLEQSAQNTKTTEMTTISYQTDEEDNFNYRIDLTSGDDKYIITYMDGKRETKRPNGYLVGTQKQTQDEAKAFIESLKNLSMFDIGYVTNITVEDSESGVYKILISDQYQPSSSASIKDQVYTVTMKDGKLMKLRFEYAAKTGVGTAVVEVTFTDN